MKHLKTKTELHQNVIDKCLKSLLQKQLIKAIKNVKVCSESNFTCIQTLLCTNEVPYQKDIHPLPSRALNSRDRWTMVYGQRARYGVHQTTVKRVLKIYS